MRSCFAPGFRFARRLDGVANVLAVAKRRFPEQTPVPATHFDAVTRIRLRLFATDIELHGAIDLASREIGGGPPRPTSPSTPMPNQSLDLSTRPPQRL